jgi:hypothetical protein
MSKVAQIEAELHKLSQAELRQVRDWLDQHVQESDVTTGAETSTTALHEKWVNEALASGPATPLVEGEIAAAIRRGIEHAERRKKTAG